MAKISSIITIAKNIFDFIKPNHIIEDGAFNELMVICNGKYHSMYDNYDSSYRIINYFNNVIDSNTDISRRLINNTYGHLTPNSICHHNSINKSMDLMLVISIYYSSKYFKNRIKNELTTLWDIYLNELMSLGDMYTKKCNGIAANRDKYLHLPNEVIRYSEYINTITKICKKELWVNEKV